MVEQENIPVAVPIIWKCQEIEGQGKPKGKTDYARGCGLWQVQKTKKLFDRRSMHNWQGTCKNCGKRQRLNLGNIQQGFVNVDDAKTYRDRLNERDGWVEIIEYRNARVNPPNEPVNDQSQEISPLRGNISPSDSGRSKPANYSPPLRQPKDEIDEQIKHEKMMDEWGDPNTWSSVDTRGEQV